ncbi:MULTISPECIES: hypothetical protein [Sphingobacterium]|uniref:hypothetical protein n=1 Tax=Sphingobacterium TaxID=28453 RepID=UPI0008A578FD|nr:MULTISPECIES: hypothetical protein [Sphingobacterium]OFV09599.1 hypothetical protein HMPREF3127_23335 [Sphingobacterium sp. HMSC13C05]HAL52573.1 hypothetical protein [Sphingobacterium sp.]
MNKIEKRLLKGVKFQYKALFILMLFSTNSFGQKVFDNLTSPKEGANYYVTIDGKGPYRVKINDIPFLTVEKQEGSITFLANHTILGSGEQEISWEVGPGGKIGNASVKESRWKNGKYSPDSIIWDSSKNKEKSFTATVPYNLAGWSKSSDFSLNPENIKAAKKWFSEMISLAQQHKGSEFMNRIAFAEQQSFLMNYIGDDEAKQRHKNWAVFFNTGKFEIGNGSEDEIEVVAYGKLVHLKGKNNQGGIKILSPDGQTTYLDIFLHFPARKQQPEAIMINFRQETSDFRNRVK